MKNVKYNKDEFGRWVGLCKIDGTSWRADEKIGCPMCQDRKKEEDRIIARTRNEVLAEVEAAIRVMKEEGREGAHWTQDGTKMVERFDVLLTSLQAESSKE